MGAREPTLRAQQKSPPGTIYPLFSSAEGCRVSIVDRWEEGAPSIMKRPKRRLYWLTGEGRLGLERY